MNKKGQVSAVFSAFVVIILTGVMLTIFMPTIDDFRIEQIENLEEGAILEKLLLFALKPLIWGMYIFLSIFAMVFTVNSAQGVI